MQVRDFGPTAIYVESNCCATSNRVFFRYLDILSDGDCFFDSIKHLTHCSMSTDEMRASLCDSLFIESCGDPNTALQILLTPKEYADSDIVYILSQHYEVNICIHFYENSDQDKNKSVITNNNQIIKDPKLIGYLHYKSSNNPHWLHLHLMGQHYTPLLPAHNLNKSYSQL